MENTMVTVTMPNIVFGRALTALEEVVAKSHSNEKENGTWNFNEGVNCAYLKVAVGLMNAAAGKEY